MSTSASELGRQPVVKTEADGAVQHAANQPRCHWGAGLSLQKVWGKSSVIINVLDTVGFIYWLSSCKIQQKLYEQIHEIWCRKTTLFSEWRCTLLNGFDFSNFSDSQTFLHTQQTQRNIMAQLELCFRTSLDLLWALFCPAAARCFIMSFHCQSCC